MSQFDNSTSKVIKFKGFTNNDFVAGSEVFYIETPALTESPASVKVRVDTTSPEVQLDPQHTKTPTSYEKYGYDSNKLEILFTPDEYLFEKIHQYFGTFNIDDYIGDPRQQYNSSYTNLDDFLRNKWQKYLLRFNINDFLRLFLLYDRGLFEQLKSLIPARADSRTGFSLGSTDALHRNKLRRKPLVAKKPSYEGSIKKDYQVDFKIETKPVEGVLRNTEKIVDFAINTLDIEGSIQGEVTSIKALTSTLTSGSTEAILKKNSVFVNDKNIYRQTQTLSYSLGYMDTIWNGVRLSGPGINLPTPETLDNRPVVQRIVIRESGTKAKI